MKKTIFLTGATGNMGWAGFQELHRTGRYHLKLLVLDDRKSRKRLSEYRDDPSVTIIWGNLLNLDDVMAGIKDADYVLHVGGMVSPAADRFPEKTMEVNVTAALNIVKAVKKIGISDTVRIVYIGSVAQYGDRRNPVHWGSAGDPVMPSRYDTYSVSKCLAEKIIVDSGIRYWVSLRQTGILYPGILKVVDATAFHVPVSGVLEWVTLEDSGRLLEKVCGDTVPDSFWNRFYNISSGPDYRMTNYEFETRIFKCLGLPDIEKVFRPEWFALKNFHGMWYTDSDTLEACLHFRSNQSADEYFRKMQENLPFHYRILRIIPASVIRRYMKRYAYGNDRSTQYWVRHDAEKLQAYYGGLECYESIRDWGDVRPGTMDKDQCSAEVSCQLFPVERGYDVDRSIYDLGLSEVSAAASFRGGKFLGPADRLGTPFHVFEWECEHGHRFSASLEYVLLGGGWCDRCLLEHAFTRHQLNRFVMQIRSKL